MGSSWCLLRLHVQRPGRIVTPDLLLTRAWVEQPGLPQCAFAVQRLLLLPAIQLEPGDWAVAPALASVRAMELYHVPAIALTQNGQLASIFLARQALAAMDIDAPLNVLLDGEATADLTSEPPVDTGVTARIKLGYPMPLGSRTSLALSASAGATALPETWIMLEPIT